MGPPRGEFPKGGFWGPIIRRHLESLLWFSRVFAFCLLFHLIAVNHKILENKQIFIDMKTFENRLDSITTPEMSVVMASTSI